jgi:hypothetical protein
MPLTFRRFLEAQTIMMSHMRASFAANERAGLPANVASVIPRPLLTVVLFGTLFILRAGSLVGSGVFDLLLILL